MVGKNRRVRYDCILGHYYYLRLMSRNCHLFSPDNLDTAFENFLNTSNQKLIGYLTTRGDNAYLNDLKGRPISSLYPDDKSETQEFIITDGEICIRRTPEKVFLDTCEANTKLGIRLPKDYDHDKAIVNIE